MGRIKIDPRLWIVYSALLLIVPLQWLIAWLIAVFFHEFCHWLAVRLCGGHVLQFSVGYGGANMQCVNLSEKAYLLSVLSGPVGGLVLTLLGQWFPRLSICSWVLSAYNFLPVMPLDGGQVMRILIKNDRVFHTVEKILFVIISILAAIGCWFINATPLFLVIILSLLIKKRKRPCKETHCAVQ